MTYPSNATTLQLSKAYHLRTRKQIVEIKINKSRIPDKSKVAKDANTQKGSFYPKTTLNNLIYPFRKRNLYVQILNKSYQQKRRE